MELKDGDWLVPDERSRGFYYEHIQSRAWAKKRRAAFSIHGSRCDGCKTTAGPFQVHHVHYRTLGHEDPRRDLRIVCLRCHRIEHGRDPEEPEEPDTALSELRSRIHTRAVQRRRVRAAAARLRRMRRDHHEHQEEPEQPKEPKRGHAGTVAAGRGERGAAKAHSGGSRVYRATLRERSNRGCVVVLVALVVFILLRILTG